jgi:hypothetical protein
MRLWCKKPGLAADFNGKTGKEAGFAKSGLMTGC